MSARKAALGTLGFAAAIALGGAVAVGALAATAGTAEAGTTINAGVGVCYKVGTEHIITANDEAMLVFEEDGDLALYSTADMSSPIWSAGTAGSQRELCVGANGDLFVDDYETGQVFWRRTSSYGGSDATLSIDDDCDLSASHGSTTLWSVAGVCPGSAETQSSTPDGWCADKTTTTTLLESDSAQLKWQSDGNLVLYGKGAFSDTPIWYTWSSSPQGNKLCLEDGGKFVVYNSAGSAAWTGYAGGSTSDTYDLEVDECTVKVVDFNTGATVYSSGSSCPTSRSVGYSKTRSTTDDQVIIDNTDAELAFTAAGALTLRTKAGSVIWTTGDHSDASAFTFESNGNLYIRNASGSALWSTSFTSSYAGSKLSLDGCKVSMTTSSGHVDFSHGNSDCNFARRPFDNTTYMTGTAFAFGDETILRGSDSYLNMTSGGRLCLYTSSGGSVWCANSNGGAGIGLVSLGLSGTTATLQVWNGTSTYTTTQANGAYLALDDGCALTIKNSSGSVLKTLNASCLVGNFTYEKDDGNSTFGSTFTQTATAETKTDGTKETDAGISLKVKLFGNAMTLYQSDALEARTSSGTFSNSASVEVLGATVDVDVKVEKDFASEEDTWWAGAIPVEVSASIGGELKLSVSIDAQNHQITITPDISLGVTVQAGIGVGGEGSTVSAGVRGELDFLDVGLPISMKIYQSGSAWKFNCTGTLTIETLSGTLSLYAQAYVKLFGVKIKYEWTYRLFSWTGLQWSKQLFSWDKSF
ncbi:MAG TPA: hypothetical protein VHE35_03825 [Kofleriaceae bacterium]|nr:hypothetical protein [Kofleriaceae bacterium]